MSTPSWIKDLLQGGLPTALDLNVPVSQQSQPQATQVQYVEKNPPQDIAPQSTVQSSGQGIVPGVSNGMLIIAGGGVLLLLGILVASRR